MDVNIIQALLVFIVAFIMGIDQFSFLESLYQPIVTCPIIGAILGDFQLGVVVGGAYQLIQIGSMPIGGAQPPNAILGGIMATVFAVSLNMEATADGVGAAGLYGGTALGDVLKEFSYDYSWVMAGLDAAGGAMKFVGFAILMKVMMSGEMWGFLLAGFAMSVICSANPSTSGATLLLCAFVGAAIAIYDFLIHTKIKSNVGTNTGGESDGI